MIANILPSIREDLAEQDPDLLFADGFDDCILGVAHRCGLSVVLYDEDAVVAKLAKEMDNDFDDAYEFFSFNIAGAYVGERTPYVREPGTTGRRTA